MRLAKGFQLTDGIRAELSLDVINLFNSKQLRIPAGADLTNYMEDGRMPHMRATYLDVNGDQQVFEEPNEWTIYMPQTLPREIFFGFGLEF